MGQVGIFRAAVVGMLPATTVLSACSAHHQPETPAQHEGARPTRSASGTQENLEKAGQATLAVLVVGVVRENSLRAVSRESDKRTLRQLSRSRPGFWPIRDLARFAPRAEVVGQPLPCGTTFTLTR